MIKRIEDPGEKALISSKELRDFIEKFESEINRGISALCVLNIIKDAGAKGNYGYSILKKLREKTNDILVIEEGTLYPLLRKLEKEKIINSKRQEVDGRLRKNYFMTEIGLKVFDRMSGFYSVLTESIAPLFDVLVDLNQDKYHYCPMCANRVSLDIKNVNFCDACGYNIKNDIKKRRAEHEGK